MRPPVEEVFNYYDVPIVHRCDDELKYLCPFHQSSGHQKHNSSINARTGKWHCYSADCGQSGTITKFVTLIAEVTYDRAKYILTNKFHYDPTDVFADDPVENFKFVEQEVKLPKTYKLIPYNHPHVLENKFDVDVLHTLGVGIDLAKDPMGNFLHSDSLILPYMHNDRCVGYALKYLHGKYKYEFPKKHYLYGIDISKSKPYVIICEGPRDTWRVLQHGEPSVSLSGSKPSTEQINLILKHWSKVYLCLDSDEAGEAGTKLLASQLRGLVDLNRIYLPEGCDPCDIKSYKLWKSLKREYVYE